MNIAVLGCENIKDKTCMGCHRCLMAFDKRDGEFARYQDNEEAKLRALVHCGGCPGNACINRLINLKAWMGLKGETIDAVHIGSCLLNSCPNRETIVATVKEKAGVEVIEGSHPYLPPTVFG